METWYCVVQTAWRHELSLCKLAERLTVTTTFLEMESLMMITRSETVMYIQYVTTWNYN